MLKALGAILVIAGVLDFTLLGTSRAGAEVPRIDAEYFLAIVLIVLGGIMLLYAD